jgi:sugar/nucleoside kinase (ribokinase family)
MAEAPFDVIGVGNAIVDVLAQADDAFLDRNDLDKGMMTLIDTDRARALYKSMGPAIEVSGGSAANTLAGLASLGGKGAYIGKVRNDQLGGVFTHDIRAAGVDFRSWPAKDGPPTARCLIFVTPDAQRTMQTYLGISVELSSDDIDPEAIGSAQITYLEGYLFDRDEAKKAFVKAAEIAHAADRKVALTLSDPFCVDRHRAEFRHLVSGHVDILFANQAEIESLYEVSKFDDGLQRIRGNCEIAALTRGPQGSVVICGDELHVIDAHPVANVIDTTGAGDLYAAGFLYGLTHGKDLATSGRIGSLCAAEIISHFGARSSSALSGLLKPNRL